MGERSRILVIDKTGGLPTSQERFDALGRAPDLDLHVLCPGFWKEHGLRFTAEPGSNSCYTVHTGNVRFPGYYARSFYTRGLGAALRTVRPHLIHLLEEPYSLFSLQTLILRNRICPDARVVFYTWENIYRDFRYPARVQSIYRYADRRMHREASAAFCATADAAEVLKRKGFKREIRVIPYGVESLYLDRLDDDSLMRADEYPFIIGYAGRLLEMKGVDLLVRVLPEFPDARLHLVGSGPQRDRLHDLAESLGVADRVRFFGPVPSSEVRRRMEAFSVLVLPSRTTRWWSEQLGRCLLEAMALGIPVVAACSGSIPRVVNDAGLLFPEDDVDTLIAHLNELQRRPDLVRRLVRAGKERVRTDYTWEVFARRSHAFYRRILGLPS